MLKISFSKIAHGNMPLRGVYIAKFRKIYGFGVYIPHPCTDNDEI